MILHASASLDSCRPLRNAERVQRFRLQAVPLTDEARMDHEARIAAGVHWQDQFRRRPIPKHRALVAVQN